MAFNGMIHHLSTEVLLMEQEQEEHIRLQLEGKRDSRASSFMRAERLEDEYHIECFQNAEDEKYDPSLTSFENFCNRKEENIYDSNEMEVISEAPHCVVKSPDCSMPPGHQRAQIETWIAGVSASHQSPLNHSQSIDEATGQKNNSRGRSLHRAPRRETRKGEGQSRRGPLSRRRNGKSKQKNSEHSRQSESRSRNETMEDATIDPENMSDDAITRQIGVLEHIISAGLRLVRLYEERERRNLAEM